MPERSPNDDMLHAMQLTTIVDIPKSDFEILPGDTMLFVGSCFADNMGKRFIDDCFRATVNPYGVMYNPVSVRHTIEQCPDSARVAIITLGTNHVYRLRSTGEVVDNCRKMPHALFSEEKLDIDECTGHLRRCIDTLTDKRGTEHVILTVSPIRYAKYGYHESRLSKAVLLLAADRMVREKPLTVSYFPAYEIMNDELRDYRFYRPDMLHPTDQAADYIHQRFEETYFAPETREFLQRWKPIKAALGHRPFDPSSADYLRFREQTRAKIQALQKAYPQITFHFNH